MNNSIPSVTLPDWVLDRQIVFLDFDGVFLASNEFKISQMSKALAPFGRAKVDPFLSYFRVNMGNTRMRHFRVFHEDYLNGMGKFEEFYETYAGIYGRLVSEGYSQLPLIEGCRDFLESAAVAGLSCRIVTGGDPAQVKVVLDKKNITHLIDSVDGAPVEKSVHLQNHLSTARCLGETCILFGDGLADQRAANSAGIEFVFVSEHALVSVEDVRRQGQNCRTTPNLSPKNLCNAERLNLKANLLAEQ